MVLFFLRSLNNFFFLSTMHKRWIRRRLPVLIFTFFIILYVDFQLRTNSLPKVSVAHHPSPGAQHHSTQQTPSPAKNTQNPANNSRSGNGGHKAIEDSHVTRPKLKLEDIFIAVKTTGRFHKTRLALLLETWISRTRAHVSVNVCVVMSCFDNYYTLSGCFHPKPHAPAKQ